MLVLSKAPEPVSQPSEPVHGLLAGRQGRAPSPAGIEPVCSSCRLARAWPPPPPAAAVPPILHACTHTGRPVLPRRLPRLCSPAGCPVFAPDSPTTFRRQGPGLSAWEILVTWIHKRVDCGPLTTSLFPLVSWGESPSPAGGQVLGTRTSTPTCPGYPLLLPPHKPQGLRGCISQGWKDS